MTCEDGKWKATTSSVPNLEEDLFLFWPLYNLIFNFLSWTGLDWTLCFSFLFLLLLYCVVAEVLFSCFVWVFSSRRTAAKHVIEQNTPLQIFLKDIIVALLIAAPDAAPWIYSNVADAVQLLACCCCRCIRAQPNRLSIFPFAKGQVTCVTFGR